MWLMVSLAASIAATGSYSILNGKYRLGMLSIMFWGMTMMVLVDHILGYEGGAFFEAGTYGTVANGVALGVLMLLPAIAIWAVLLTIDRSRAKGNEVG